MVARTKYPVKLINEVLERSKKEKPGKLSREYGIPYNTIVSWKRDGPGKESKTKQEILSELAGLILKHGPEIAWDCYEREAEEPGAYRKHFDSWDVFRKDALKTVPDDAKVSPASLVRFVKSQPRLVGEIKERFQISESSVYSALERARAAGYNIHRRGDCYSIEALPGPVGYDKERHLFVSDKDGVYRYGVVSDNHIGSKYARLDVLHDMYDLFAARGITRVYNCGNWIDGEAKFNRYDLESWAHGLDGQINGFIKEYPKRKGITTYFVAGDDHEGWYVQDDGIDIGAYAEMKARQAGRTDLVYIGYMEAFITLRHFKTGKSSIMGVVHPGGGSAYAISYSPQKIVESYQGGEKPAVVNFGHYHKMDVFNYRNVWIIQDGCTQDQTPFMRKKRIEAHVGGVLVELRQDEKGAITDCITWQKRYFDRGYYNFQFDRAQPIRKVAAPGVAFV